MPVIRRKAPPLPETESQPVVQTPLAPRQSPLATVEEAALYLKVSQRSIRELKHLKVLKLIPHPGMKPNAKPWRFLYADLDRHIEEMRREAD
jgi:helix-turn-helix protein